MSTHHQKPSRTAWGPFITEPYYIQPTSRTDIIIAGVVFALAMVFAIAASFAAVQQCKAARRPAQSAYIWMIWIELVACVIIGILCLLYLLECIRPSFYFYMGILILWSIQVQLLLQIIINRIRIILADRRKGRNMIIFFAVVMTLINISVFCIWMPARLQISDRWIHINNIWDRTEKAIYLVLDASLNWYFIRVVKQNLVRNGLQKYDALVRFNQQIIVVSLLMDVMIIAAMSIPNGFVYAIFHPLAFLVKLNIEMAMANLIRKIATASSSPCHADFEVLTSDDFLTSDSSQGKWWRWLQRPRGTSPTNTERTWNCSWNSTSTCKDEFEERRKGDGVEVELDTLQLKEDTVWEEVVPKAHVRGDSYGN